MDISEFKTPSGEDMVILRRQDYDRIMEPTAQEAANPNVLPRKFQMRLENGENPVKVWRNYRGIYQATLAKRIGITQTAVSKLETKGVRTTTLARKVAEALKCDITDLVQTYTKPPKPQPKRIDASVGLLL